ncbi:hypothetical protein CCZ01_02515 [Helicobacter monodelphidis]|uniref:PulJ/GspJ family protein n=1 Tax=Helicobacter sp. 15-1451 TaxID=2004995 RepID=UPI000DCD565B|nr:hypothetical protein [Helicobacter sp. 15-1451]RAX58674.1 hypothetical protein CCZ01_02515 [Helicobacter sp. 15-1451]
MKNRILPCFSLLELILSLTISSLVIVLFAQISFTEYQRFSQQKAIEINASILNNIMLQVDRHIKDIFRPSLQITPNTLSFYRYALPYPLVFDPAQTSQELTILYPHSLPNINAQLYCVNTKTYHRITQITSHSLQLKETLPQSCEYGYLLTQERIQILYASDQRLKLQTPHSNYILTSPLQSFQASLNQNLLSFSFCMRDKNIEKIFCKEDPTLSICTQGQCRAWTTNL